MKPGSWGLNGLLAWAPFVCASDRQGCLLRVESFVWGGDLFLRGYDFFDDYMLIKSCECGENPR